MSEEIPAAPVDRVNWVRQIDGQVAVSITAFGSTLAFLFPPDKAEQLADGLMGVLPQQADEAAAIGVSPGHPAETDVDDVAVTTTGERDRPIQMELRSGEHGIQIRVGLREAMRWQRRLAALVSRHLRQTGN